MRKQGEDFKKSKDEEMNLSEEIKRLAIEKETWQQEKQKLKQRLKDKEVEKKEKEDEKKSSTDKEERRDLTSQITSIFHEIGQIQIQLTAAVHQIIKKEDELKILKDLGKN